MSAKSHNNYLIALRGVFALEYRGRRALDSPMIGIENMPVVKKLPDPLTAAERDSILHDMTRHYDARVVAYFVFMFFTGCARRKLLRYAGRTSTSTRALRPSRACELSE